jgi:hypothetical protein
MLVQTALVRGVVHVSFEGGGLFLPARTPYDRQTLIEHVKDRVRCKGEVQVLMQDRRWMVRLSEEAEQPICSACGSVSESTCHSSSVGPEVYCVTCVFGDHPQAA